MYEADLVICCASANACIMLSADVSYPTVSLDVHETAPSRRTELFVCIWVCIISDLVLFA